MSETEQPHPERIRLPEVSKRASRFIAALEAASEGDMVSLDLLTGGEGSIIDILEGQLAEADRLYALHDSLFFSGGIANPPDLDLEAIMDLSQRLVLNADKDRPFIRSAAIALSTVQFAEAGARLAAQPSAASISGEQDRAQELMRKSAELARQATEKFATRGRGRLSFNPAGRIEYPGHLLDTHYAFWTHPLIVNHLEPKLSAQVQKFILQTPAKTRAWDTHSYYGRPSREIARQSYIDKIRAFEHSLQGDPLEGFDAAINLADLTPHILSALDAVLRQGYSPNDCLRLAVENSMALGNLSERTTEGLPLKDARMFHVSDSGDGPELTIDYPESSHRYGHNPAFSDATSVKLQKIDESGGICPARNFIELRKGGETHQNITMLAAAVQKSTGVWPSILREIEDKVFVHPGGLLANYIILGIASNSR